MELLTKIKITKLNKGKSTMTAGDKWQTTIEHNNNKISMIYNANIYNTVTKEDLLHALIMDANSYSQTANVDDFASGFGYTKPSQAIKVYEACKKQFNNYNKLFSKKEQKQLENYFENY